MSESGFRPRSTGSPENLPTPRVTVGSLGPLPLPLKGDKEQSGLCAALQAGPGELGLVPVPGSALVSAHDPGVTHVPRREGGCHHVPTDTRATHIRARRKLTSAQTHEWPWEYGRTTAKLRVHRHAGYSHTQPRQWAPEPRTRTVNTRLRGPSRETKGCRPLHTSAQVTLSVARGSVAWPALDGQSASLAGLGPRPCRWRGHDHPLAEVAPGGPFVPGATEIMLHGAAAVRVHKAAVKRVHVQASWG